MAYQLSDDARATALRATRVMIPHDMLPDECYAKVVAQIEADAGNDEDVAATVEQGVAQLNDSRRFAELDADAQLEALKTAMLAVALLAFLSIIFTRRLPDRPLTPPDPGASTET